MKKTITVLFALAFGAFRWAGADEPFLPGQGELDVDMRLMENGDAQVAVRYRLSLSDYTRIKRMFPNSYYFIRDFKPQRMNYDVSDATSSYDDATSSILLKLTGRGLAYNCGKGMWNITVDREMNYVNHARSADGSDTFYYYWSGMMAGSFSYKGQVKFFLPAKTSEAGWNDSGRVITYVLPPCKAKGDGLLTVDIQVKEKLMTCPYKVYGLGFNLRNFAAQWLCMSRFYNKGSGIIRDLKVRYQLAGYSDWTTYEKYAEVIPGQTIVSVCYPALHSNLARLKDRTPGDVIVEYEYVDSNGEVRHEEVNKRITILGVNEFIFSNLLAGESYGSWHEDHNNAPLLAAWVARNDPVVIEFAALANKNAGGKGAHDSDANALAVLGECYNLMRINDFTYQHPHSMQDASISFDPKNVQNIRLPREVIRTKSGTCIDLAVLYASMANAVGLRPYLIVVPGHCFPAIQMPGGQLVGVEVTGVRGGLKFGSASFNDMVQQGSKELAEAVKEGRCFKVDVQALWSEGISTPELEDLPADALSRWGIRGAPEARAAAAQPAPAAQPPPAAEPAQPAAAQPPPATAAALALPVLPRPAGEPVQVVKFRPGLTLDEIRAALIQAATKRKWVVAVEGHNQVLLTLSDRSMDAKVTADFDQQEMRFFNSDSRRTRGNAPIVPSRWINYLASDLRPLQ